MSPGFVADFPNVINKDLIPDPILNAMMPAWASGSFAPRPIHIVRLFDVFLTGEGLIFDQQRKLIQESITQYSEPSLSEAYARVQAVSEFKTEWGSAILLRKRGDANYGHWMVEALPKLWAAETVANIDICVIPERSGPMKAVMKTALRLSSANNYEILEHKDEEVIFFKQLLFVDGLTIHGSYMSPRVFSKTDQLAPTLPNTRKLFVSRKGLPRNISSESEISEALLSAGFEIVFPGKQSLEEQIEVFSSASDVVGVMGAAMTNIMFCQPGTRIVNLAPSTFPDTFFYFISLHRELNYIEIRGQNVDGGDGWDQLFSIPLAKIMEACSIPYRHLP